MSNRMNRAGWVAAAALGLLVLAGIAGVARGGPLDPSAPPSSTRPQIEPRIPISQLPFVINTPGSYYVTANLSNFSGITINSDDVTVDLNGFTLWGGNLGGSNIGINVTTFPTRNVTIKNGIVEGYPTGIGLGAATASRIEDVTVRFYTNYGIQLGQDSVVEDCIVDGVGTAPNGVALNARSVMRECSVIGHTQMGVFAFEASTIEDSQILDNGSLSAAYAGIYLAQADVTVRRNHLANSAGRDIRTASSTPATIIDNVLSGCGSVTLGGGVAVVFAPLQGQEHSNVTHASGYCP